MPLDQDVQAVLDELAAMAPPPISTLSPERARRRPGTGDAVHRLLRRHGIAPSAPPSPGSGESLRIAGVPSLVVRPPAVEAASDGLPVLVWIHGGGFVLGDLVGTLGLARELAADSGAIVVSVGYRLAPEHPFPAALEDVVAVLRWTLAHGPELGGDPQRVMVAGESAGGTLAAGACIALAQAGERTPAGQALLTPVTDWVREDWDSYRDRRYAEPLSVATMAWFAHHLAAGPEGRRVLDDPRLSPLRAPDATLAALPPATVIVAAGDPLHDQGVAYTERLAEQGVPTRLHRHPRLTHDVSAMAPVAPAARLAVAQVTDAVRELSG